MNMYLRKTFLRLAHSFLWFFFLSSLLFTIKGYGYDFPEKTERIAKSGSGLKPGLQASKVFGYSFSEEYFLEENVKSGYNPRRAPGFKYIEIGAGVGIWHQSDQAGLENAGLPFHFFAEYGNTANPLSFGIAVNTGARYVQEDVYLRPNYIPVYAKYNFSPLFYFIPKALELNGLAGIMGWTAGLTDERNGSQTANENRFQSDGGVGIMAGAGAIYRIKNFGVGAQFTYFYGKGKYVLAGTEATDVYTGSAQLNILVSYRFILGGDRLNCPTYVR